MHKPKKGDHMRFKNLFIFLLLSISTLSNAAMDRNISEYNLDSKGTGFLNGEISQGTIAYDPVSSFEGKPLIGKNEFNLQFEGVNYLFANASNMKEFLNAPDKYEPTFGGWCARAMVEGQKVHIQTKYFTIVGNRAFYFVGARAKRQFDRNIKEFTALADAEWKKISGESPRL